LVIPLLYSLPVYADWGADTRLTNDAGNSYYPIVATSGNTVHVVWKDDRDGNNEIYYKSSTDGGTTWSTDTRLTDDSGNSDFPSLAVSGNNVHVAWQDNRTGNWDIFYKCSTDGGNTWGNDNQLTDHTGSSLIPSIAASGVTVHVTWVDDRDSQYEIYYKRSTNGGTSWGSDTRLTNDANNSMNPSIAVYENVVHVTWDDTRDSDYEIYYKRSTDGGTTWDADTRLTNNTGNSTNPSVAASVNNVHIVWDDDRDGNNEVYYKRSTDGGTTWGSDTRLTNDTSISSWPQVALSGNTIHVVWHDYRDGNGEIYYKRSADNGITWDADTRLTNFDGFSIYPTVATSGNNVHVVWQDTRDMNYEIYYKRYTPPLPIITSFNPSTGNTGTTVIITGANFTGTTAVSFGGTRAASFTVNSDTRITAIAAAGSTGKITVTTLNGTATSAALFTFIENTLIGTTPAPHGSSMPGVSLPSQGPVGIPNITVTSASLSNSKVTPGTPVTVTANVANTGTGNGTSVIKVYVNGEMENNQGVTVNSGDSMPIIFTVSRNEPGTYDVYVGGTSAGSFTVDQFTPETILIISGALVFFALVMGIIYTTRRKTRG